MGKRTRTDDTYNTQRAVTLNADQTLYVIPATQGGYSCLGVDVLIERFNRLAAEIGWRAFPLEERATLDGYKRYEALQRAARELAFSTHKRFTCELSPQLVGLEGHHVEVIDRYGETRRFIVGRSTGWTPIHLEIKRRNSTDGMAADREYATVRDLGKVR